MHYHDETLQTDELGTRGPFSSLAFLSMVVVASAGVALFWSPHAYGGVAGSTTWDFSQSLDELRAVGARLIDAAAAMHARAPALTLGLGSVVALLVLALLARAVQLLLPSRQAAAAADMRDEDGATSLVTGFSRPRRARLEGAVLGEDNVFEIRGMLTRIGRADDNEVVIDSADLAPYHAAIERTAEYDNYLCDLTRGGRRAARVNGRKAVRQRLCDGDVIALGKVTLTYRTSAP